MSKGISGHFKGTTGFLRALRESDIDSNNDPLLRGRLPGSKGILLKHRLSDQQMTILTNKYGVEFAQVYQLGPGKNGGGGKYFLYSGNRNSVLVPVSAKVILINHTHPNGTAYPSPQDMKLMELYSQVGSPQRQSSIIPCGRESIKFTKNGKVR